MIFVWDKRKAAANHKKHGVDFHEAATVFNDSLSFTFADEDHSTEEQRLLIIGLSIQHRLLVVAHTDEDDTIRIISARQVTKGEQKYYEENQE